MVSQPLRTVRLRLRTLLPFESSFKFNAGNLIIGLTRMDAAFTSGAFFSAHTLSLFSDNWFYTASFYFVFVYFIP